MLLVGLVLVPAAAGTLEAVLDARARLGPAVWSRVLRIENDRPEGPYPAQLHALVFELGGVLWFYTSTDGTQSFSLHRGRLAEEKADFRPLLEDIEPGFRRHEDVTDGLPQVRRAGQPGVLPNGCFIDSVAAYLQRRAAGRALGPARLLSFYWHTREGRRGHTVLLFEEGGEHWAFDPFVDERPRRWSATFDRDALAAAREFLPPASRRRLIQARYWELPPPAAPERPPAPASVRVAAERLAVPRVGQPVADG